MASRDLLKHVARTAGVAVTAVAASQYVEDREQRASSARVASAAAMVAGQQGTAGHRSGGGGVFPWSAKPEAGGDGGDDRAAGHPDCAACRERRAGDIDNGGGSDIAGRGSGGSDSVAAAEPAAPAGNGSLASRARFFQPTREEIMRSSRLIFGPIPLPDNDEDCDGAEEGVESADDEDVDSALDHSVLRPPPSPSRSPYESGSDSSSATVSPAAVLLAEAVLADPAVVEALVANATVGAVLDAALPTALNAPPAVSQLPHVCGHADGREAGGEAGGADGAGDDGAAGVSRRRRPGLEIDGVHRAVRDAAAALRSSSGSDGGQGSAPPAAAAQTHGEIDWPALAASLAGALASAAHGVADWAGSLWRALTAAPRPEPTIPPAGLAVAAPEVYRRAHRRGSAARRRQDDLVSPAVIIGTAVAILIGTVILRCGRGDSVAALFRTLRAALMARPQQ